MQLARPVALQVFGAVVDEAAQVVVQRAVAVATQPRSASGRGPTGSRCPSAGASLRRCATSTPPRTTDQDMTKPASGCGAGSLLNGASGVHAGTVPQAIPWRDIVGHRLKQPTGDGRAAAGSTAGAKCSATTSPPP